MSGTYRADKLPPPPKESASAQEIYRWNYRLFEMLNGIIDIVAYQKTTEKGVVSGYASLDATGKVPDAQIPAAITRDAEAAAAYAPIAKGVTNGDTHDHVGGDGAQIAHTSLSAIGTNTHAQVDTHLAAVAPHSGHEVTTAKDSASGYAGLNASSRITKGVITTDDLIVNLATKGLVLLDTQATPHFWRISVSTLGVLTTADLGVTPP